MDAVPALFWNVGMRNQERVVSWDEKSVDVLRDAHSSG
jgi:hypothetical protein